jgi:hypothetical protein
MRTIAVTVLAAAGLLGCAQRPPIYFANDKALRKPSVELAADAVKRFPYKADAPRGGEAVGRAQVGYWWNTIEIVNLSDTDWDDVEIWVNKSYVVHVPKMARGNDKLLRVPFLALFNDSGKNFPVNNKEVRVETVEIFRDGKMYDVKLQLAD